MRIGVPLAIAASIALVVCIACVLPTGLYLYVEPRGRRLWAREGDAPRSRRAPLRVRLAAWLSFLLGELAVPWIAVPVACGVLVYLQAKLGIWRPVGMAVTAAAGVLAVVQALLALRLVPLGVKLLMRDTKVCGCARGRARSAAVAHAAVLGATWLLFSLTQLPKFVHPWLGAALGWTALRPEMIYGAASLVHALLLWQCQEQDSSDTGKKGSSR